MEKETQVGIAVAVGLLVLFSGTFVYASDYYRANSYDVTWRTVQEDGPSDSGTTQAGSPTERTYTVERTNLVEVAFTLTWTDDEPDTEADRFILDVDPPGDRTSNSANEDDGAIEVTVGYPDPPPVEPQFGDRDDVRARLLEEHSRTNGTGTWTVTITVQPGGDMVGDVTGMPSDTGNSWSLASVLTYYEPDL